MVTPLSDWLQVNRLLAYAVVGGLIVPPAPFFPANTFILRPIGRCE